jgi:drug/metabolite transporter (DMT)-like permease
VKPRRVALAPRLAALAAVALWGVSFVATKAALRELSPITLIFSRFTLGVIVLFLILTFKHDLFIPPRSAWPMLWLMGFVGIFVHQMLQVHGLTLTTAIRTGWLIGLIPIWSSVLAAIFLGEGFGAGKVVGLVLGTMGAILVITRGELSSRVLALPTTRGDLFILASTISWAIYTILGRETLKRVGSSVATAVAMALGWIMLIPFFVHAAGWQEFRSVSATGLMAVVFLGGGCSGLGYLFWYAALERLEASQVAAFLHLEPLVTLVAAVALLGEPVAVSTILGGVLVVVGVLTVQSANSQETPNQRLQPSATGARVSRRAATRGR